MNGKDRSLMEVIEKMKLSVDGSIKRSEMIWTVVDPGSGPFSVSKGHMYWNQQSPDHLLVQL